MLSGLVGALGGRSVDSRALAEVVESLIRSGALGPGEKLPTVRRLAAALGVSPATVTAAWSGLRTAGLVATDRRRGSVVHPSALTDLRPWSQHVLDQALPDRMLLPDLGDAMAAAVVSAAAAPQDTAAIDDRLMAAVVRDWPSEAEAFTVANGGYEATLLALRATVPPGGTVAVEQPTAPRILDTLRSVRAEPVPFMSDRQGPIPQSLERALFERPDVVLFQPRSQMPTGSSVTAERAAELAEVLDAADCRPVVIEDDNIGPASAVRAPSLASYGADLPHIVIRSYCKAYGVDIRTSVISGPSGVISRIDRLRDLGLVGTSRLLQHALAYLLGDDKSERALRVARHRHRERRTALVDALNVNGVGVDPNSDGFALWIPVVDEDGTHAELAAKGVHVGRGRECFAAPAEPHLWIATGLLPDNRERIGELADIVAGAAVGRTMRGVG